MGWNSGDLASLQVSYVYSCYLGGCYDTVNWRPWLKIGSVTKPTTNAVIIDGLHSTFTGVPQRRWYLADWSGYGVDYPHNSQANSLMLDGHIERFPAGRLLDYSFNKILSGPNLFKSSSTPY
jgi:prepilin-type processing-associated H-X9-DG protein